MAQNASADDLLERTRRESKQIFVRAPKGEVPWMLVELQGTMEARNGDTSLEGIELGKLVREVRARAQHTKQRSGCYFFSLTHARAHSFRLGRTSRSRYWSWAR